MSDVYNLSDDARWILSRRRGIASQAVQDLDANPDQAARAVLLGNATGVPPSVVHDDLENFEQQHKAGITAKILRDNSDLRDWVEEDPMAAKVANDDWGRLDDISRAARRHMLTGWPDIGFYKLTPSIPAGQEVVRNAVRGFVQGFNEVTAAGEQKTQEDYEKLMGYGWPGFFAAQAMVPGKTKMDFLNAVFHGVLTGIERGLGREAAGFAEFMLADMARHGSLPHPTEIQAIGMRFEEAYRLAEPYIEAGKPIPDKLHPLIDAMKAEESRLGIDQIDALLDEAEKSPVRERAADIFTKLLRRATGDKEIAFPLEAIDRLYGNRIPAVDDGILGFDKDIVGKIERARPTMGEV